MLLPLPGIGLPVRVPPRRGRPTLPVPSLLLLPLPLGGSLLLLRGGSLLSTRRNPSTRIRHLANLLRLTNAEAKPQNHSCNHEPQRSAAFSACTPRASRGCGNLGPSSLNSTLKEAEKQSGQAAWHTFTPSTWGSSSASGTWKAWTAAAGTCVQYCA